MQPIKSCSLAGSCLLLAALHVVAGPSEPFLGDAPAPPTDVSHLPRRMQKLSVTGGFTVNPASREEVRSFYNAVFTSSDGVPMGGAPNVGTCTPGTNAAAFDQAVLRRLNWFRALAGLPANVSFAETNNFKDREAAVMMSANRKLDHYPTNTWSCYTATGAEAARNSNLALGSSGPDAIVGYMCDYGANNVAAGHRRWLLYPQTQIMGTGDVPEQGGFYEANATWVFDGHYPDPRPTTREPYVAWPPPGFIPYPVVYPRWSFALRGANFTNATVAMKSNGVPVTVAKAAVIPGAGENTLVWVPLGLNADAINTKFPHNGTDTVYTVAISNIANAAQTWYTYAVTVFDPAVPGNDYFPPVISGPAQPVVGVNNSYVCRAITNATGYQWRASLRSPFGTSDGAETGLGNFIADTSAAYAVRDSSEKASGSYSFHLAHPYGDPFAAEMLTLSQVFVPLTNGALSLMSRLAYAAEGETARIQISTNAGVSWQDVFVQAGIEDYNSGPVDAVFVARSVPLGAYAGRPMQLRFNYTYTSGLGYLYPQAGFPIGWYLDEIVLTNAEVWTILGTNAAVSTNFTFNPAQTGNYNLEARALIYNEFPLDWGPVKEVRAIAAPPTIVLSPPVLTNGQVRINFTLQSGGAAGFKLLEASQAQGPWTTNTSAALTTYTPGVSFRFTTSPGGAVKFYRVQSP